jgi:hypothetical protein
MPLQPKRRWPRFSIRTLLAVVTIFCLWLGWQWRIVQERKAVARQVSGGIGFIKWWEDVGDSDDFDPSVRPVEVPWVRRLLGDKTAYWLVLDPNGFPATDEDRQKVLNTFPEARTDLFAP